MRLPDCRDIAGVAAQRDDGLQCDCLHIIRQMNSEGAAHEVAITPATDRQPNQTAQKIPQKPGVNFRRPYLKNDVTKTPFIPLVILSSSFTVLHHKYGKIREP